MLDIVYKLCVSGVWFALTRLIKNKANREAVISKAMELVGELNLFLEELDEME